MNKKKRIESLITAWLGSCLVLALSVPAGAIEPANEFLQGLRERKYFDEALLYLDQMASSTMAPIELRETLIYEKGVTLVEAARQQRDPKLRQQNLDQAQQLLQQFVGQRPDHALANAARSQLGNLIVEQARFAYDDSKRAQGADKDKLTAQANQFYEQGYKVFQDLQEQVRVQLERIPKVLDARDKQQAAMADRRTRLRADYLQTQLLAAAIREEMADVQPAGSDAAKKMLEDAASQYQEIYDKYRTRLAGLYARLYQGRCNQKIGKLRDALGFYAELLAQPDSPEEFRVLKTKTMKLAMECWLDPSEKKYVEAIKRGSEWVDKARPTEDREADWLYLRLMLARAYQMESEAPSEQGGERNPARSKGEARKLAQFVAKFTSEYQESAQQMVAALGGPDRTGEKPDPQTFDAARQAGRDALDAYQTAAVAVTQLSKRLAAAPAGQEKDDLQKQLDEAQQALTTTQADSLKYFRLALQLADQDTSIEDVNVVRYFLCYVYYIQGQYYEAALLGDFIARRFPASAGARPCAKIALASYLKLYDENQTADKQFESNQVIAIADYTVTKWPDQSEAIDALSTLVPFTINAGDLAKAEQYLTKLPETSPKRGEVELKLGQAYWRKFLEGSSQLRTWQREGFPEGVVQADKEAELKGLTQKAQAILSAGFERARSGGNVDTNLMLGALSLAQAYVDTQAADQGLKVLEDPNVGPLVLCRAKHAATTSKGFAEETYKTALRAYISALSGETASQNIDRARQVMDELKAATGDSPEGKQRLIDVYVGLASDLQKQLEIASEGSRDALSKGFDAFLTQLNQDAKELSVLNWVAETYYGLGRSFDTGDKLTARANDFYGKAANAFNNIYTNVPLDDKMKVQVRLRQAEVKRRQRQYKDAIDLYAEVLATSPMMLNVQVDAAMTYQEWASQPKLEDLFLRAIQGTRPDEKTKKNIIWGWSRIAETTARYPQFQEVANQSRLNLARCRFLYAEKKQGAEREKWLGLAEKEIGFRARMSPDMGGEPWTTQYDELLKQIQRAQGVEPIGLKKYSRPAPTTAATNP